MPQHFKRLPKAKVPKRKELTKINRELVSETVTALIQSGGNKRLASEYLGIAPDTIDNRIQRYPEINVLLSKVPSLAKSVLEASTNKAVQTVIELLDDKSSKIRLESANSILDRTGIVKQSPDTAVQVNVFNKIKEDKESFDL